MELSYGTKVLVNPKTYEIMCPKSKRVLTKLKNFNLIDCHFRLGLILGIYTDHVVTRPRIIVKGNRLDGRLPVNFLDYLSFTESGIWN